jgi:hypothetical protein
VFVFVFVCFDNLFLFSFCLCLFLSVFVFVFCNVQALRHNPNIKNPTKTAQGPVGQRLRPRVDARRRVAVQGAPVGQVRRGAGQGGVCFSATAAVAAVAAELLLLLPLPAFAACGGQKLTHKKSTSKPSTTTNK